MSTKMSVEKTSSNHSDTGKHEAVKVRPTVASLRVRSAIRAGFHFVMRNNSSSPC
jgi:hypothetical protein